MSIITAARISRRSIAALATVGVIWGTFAALVPTLKAQAGASDGQLGFALISSALGGMLAMYMAPKLAAKVGRHALPLFALLAVAAMFLPPMVKSVGMIFPVLGAMGITVALLDMSANIRVSILEDRHKMHLMNVNHAMFSFAFAGAAVIAGALKLAGWDYTQIVAVNAAIALVLALSTIETRDWSDAVEDDDSHPAAHAGLPWLAIGLTGLILFATFIGENSVEAWSALFLERVLGGAPGEGSFGPFTLGIVMGIGRLAGQLVAEKVGEERLVLWSGVLGAVGALGLSMAQAWSVAVLSIAAIALGMAVIVPTANSILAKFVRPSLKGLAISRAWLFGFTGFFVGPSLIGFISEAYDLRIAFGFVAGLISLIVPAALILRARLPRKSPDAVPVK